MQQNIILSTVLIGLIVCSSGTVGQTLLWSDQTETHFNWPAIAQYAAKPLPGIDPTAPGMDNVLSWQYKTMNYEFQTITLCRNLLAARHAGFIAANPSITDPFPPVPMMRPDDMKIPCKPVNNFDKNGMGEAYCQTPGSHPTQP